MTLSRREFAAVAALPVLAAARGQLPETKPLNLAAKAVTRGPKHHWFGYYDKCPWDATGKTLLGMEVDFCDRQPTATDAITVGRVHLTDGNRFEPLATTTAWSWQQGTMLQWLGPKSDAEIVFNSVTDGHPSATILTVATGKTRILPKPIYALSHDGTQAVTLDYARLHRLRPGYGYASYVETFADDPAPKELGIWHMDMATGKNELIIPIAKLAAYKPDARFANTYHWVNHLQFNPGGTRFVFLHRWRVGQKTWNTRIFTAKPDGSDLRLHLDTGMVSHFDWRDDRTLLMWAKTPKDGNAFCLVDVETNDVTLVGKGTLTQDGHCNYSPDRKWILNDTYPDKERKQTLMLVNVATGRRIDLNRFLSPAAFTGPTRCDLHPRWNRTGTQVCFDGSHDPQRQIYVVDVADVVA
jgi:hypothetical protein